MDDSLLLTLEVNNHYFPITLTQLGNLRAQLDSEKIDYLEKVKLLLRDLDEENYNWYRDLMGQAFRGIHYLHDALNDVHNMALHWAATSSADLQPGDYVIDPDGDVAEWHGVGHKVTKIENADYDPKFIDAMNRRGTDSIYYLKNVAGSPAIGKIDPRHTESSISVKDSGGDIYDAFFNARDYLRMLRHFFLTPDEALPIIEQSADERHNCSFIPLPGKRKKEKMPDLLSRIQKAQTSPEDPDLPLLFLGLDNPFVESNLVINNMLSLTGGKGESIHAITANQGVLECLELALGIAGSCLSPHKTPDCQNPIAV